MEDPNIGKKMLNEVAGKLFHHNQVVNKASKKRAVQGVPREMTRTRSKHTTRGSYNKNQNAGGSWF